MSIICLQCNSEELLTLYVTGMFLLADIMLAYMSIVYISATRCIWPRFLTVPLSRSRSTRPFGRTWRYAWMSSCRMCRRPSAGGFSDTEIWLVPCIAFYLLTTSAQRLTGLEHRSYVNPCHQSNTRDDDLFKFCCFCC